MFGKDYFADKIGEFFDFIGIDHFYGVTLICLIITLSYWKEYKNWDNIESWRKGLAGTALFASISFSLISILRLIGIINF